MQLIEQGTGPALVLIPGIQGRWEYVRPAVNALSRWFRVITFPLADEPSSGVAFDAARGFDNYVEQVQTALDDTGIDQAIVCGVSFGGLVALRFAATRPQRTARLVLVSTPGPGWHLRPRHEFYTRLPYLFGPVFAAETPWRLRRELAAAFPTRRARWRFAAAQCATLARAPLSFARIASRARLIGTAAAVDCSRVAVPTLVVTGEATLDHVVPDDGAVGYASIIPNAEAVVLGCTGHLGFLTRPIALAAIVRQFVDGRAPHRPDVHAQGGPVGPGLSVIHAV